MEDLLRQIGRTLKLDNQHRVNLGSELGDQKYWYLYFDLSRPNSLLICSGSQGGDGLMLAQPKPLTIDHKGRWIVPKKFREQMEGALLLRRSNHLIILFN